MSEATLDSTVSIISHGGIGDLPTIVANPGGLLRAFRRRDARRGDSRIAKAPPAHIADPWPCDYDPPTFPFAAGKWPEAMRRVWALWTEAWDEVSEGMEFESAALLWRCYDTMRAAGVEFDPAFVRSFAAWRERAAMGKDDAHDQNLGRCNAGDDLASGKENFIDHERRDEATWKGAQ